MHTHTASHFSVSQIFQLQLLHPCLPVVTQRHVVHRLNHKNAMSTAGCKMTWRQRNGTNITLKMRSRSTKLQHMRPIFVTLESPSRWQTRGDKHPKSRIHNKSEISFHVRASMASSTELYSPVAKLFSKHIAVLRRRLRAWRIPFIPLPPC